MKKIITVLIAFALILAGCGKSRKNNADNGQTALNGEPESGTSEVQTSDAEPKVDEPIVTEENEIGDYTTSFVAKFVEGGTYYISTIVTENGKSENYEIAVSGNKAALKDKSGVKIIDGDMVYFVLHDKKAVLTSPVADSMKEGFTNFIIEKTTAGIKDKLVSTGREVLNGEEFSVEEFKNDNTVTKYYYDNKTMRYVKQTNENGTEKLMQILAISHTVPEGFFDVPDDYMVQDLSKLQ